MSAHQNGRIPLAELTVTSIGVRLRADAAASVERMAPRFRREVGHALLASDGYRAMEGRWGQVWTFEDRYTSLTFLGVNDRRGPWVRSSHPSLGARWWYRRANAAAAAVPGTSNHGWATACDFAAGINSAGTKAHRWMNEHGPEYGWIWPAWAQRHPTFEPWHREYDPARDQHRGSGGGSAITPAPAPPAIDIKELETMTMPVRVRHHKGGVALVNITRGEFRALDKTANELLDRLDVPIPDGMDSLSDNEWNQVRQLVRDLAAPLNNA